MPHSAVEHAQNTKQTTTTKKKKKTEGGVPGEAIAEAFDAFEKNPSAGPSPLSVAAASRQTIQESMRLVMLVRAYQVNGHFAATLDPLGLETRPPHDELDPKAFGFG
jgi:2-oxoglutarate dehydrogenase E1 component